MRHRENYRRISAAQSDRRCVRCLVPFSSDHQDEHPGFCCDCFDLACGKPMGQPTTWSKR